LQKLQIKPIHARGAHTIRVDRPSFFSAHTAGLFAIVPRRSVVWIVLCNTIQSQSYFAGVKEDTASKMASPRCCQIRGATPESVEMKYGTSMSRPLRKNLKLINNSVNTHDNEHDDVRGACV